ncbi:REP-associated tyrosine transposase [Citrobacter farmeri]|uniref:REP-associated tyrosine transposase n=1 Tax=Citrobacter farmeri TaxID=67824 RepID=UPI00189C7D2E|nr:transposase [Citrobacter farmeri]EHK0945545.1 transposase [Citrobacter farmeri]EKX4539927.1 transposase [Citrobacter farmeri]MDB2163593.1 transposase [Citrobacter farmeri]MDZ7531044.1 transposase [Citrobacter farmeri]HBC0357063.1 transposase [Citrobacter farmeri]
MSDYRRNYINGGTWFFTVNLRNRRSHLLIKQIAALRNAIWMVKRNKPFQIDAWVVLPEHMHCIWTLPEDEYDFSARWRAIKKTFSKSLALRQVWQPRFWEHTIRDQNDYQRHVDYIYINPVKHGWVTQVKNWPYSTFHRDVKRGLYPQEWASSMASLQAGERV